MHASLFRLAGYVLKKNNSSLVNILSCENFGILTLLLPFVLVYMELSKILCCEVGFLLSSAYS